MSTSPHSPGPYYATGTATGAAPTTGMQAGGAAGPGRRRTLLACLGAYLLVAVLGITGGLVYLVTQRNAAPEMVPLELTQFSTVRPAGWTEEFPGDDEVSDVLTTFKAPDDSAEFVIALDKVGVEHGKFCDVMMDLAKEQGLAGSSAESLDPVTIDGRSAEHRRWSGEVDGESFLSDAYCVDVDGTTLYLLAEYTHPEKAEPRQEIAIMLEQWSWN